MHDASLSRQVLTSHFHSRHMGPRWRQPEGARSHDTRPPQLGSRPSEDLVQTIAGPIADQDAATLIARIEALAEKNREIHERDCFNLNPAPT
jgi:hypothetical protein